MNHADEIRGRLLSRREAIALLGAGTFILAERVYAAPNAPQSFAGCVVRPEQTEGPYFVDEKLERSDIRSDPASGAVCPGIPLTLVIRIRRLAIGACSPLANAVVDIWHCDHRGYYSDEQDSDFDTRGQKFLRGFQRTNDAGEVKFETVYPGWYPGRTVHIHVKVRTAVAGAASEFTSQLYFDDDFTDSIFKNPPYNARKGRTDRNSNDVLFADGGDKLLLKPAPKGAEYEAAIDFAIA